MKDLPVILLLLRMVILGASSASLRNYCTDLCVSEMQAVCYTRNACLDRTFQRIKLIDSAPIQKGAGAQSRSSFFYNQQGDGNFMGNFFMRICGYVWYGCVPFYSLVVLHNLLRAYESVDSCLAKCEARSNQHIVDLRQAYAGLQLICKERKTGIASSKITATIYDVKPTLEFFDAVPCLAEYEPISMLRCSNEINQSQETTTTFINSLVGREFHNVQSRFSSLCRLLLEENLYLVYISGYNSGT